MKKSMLKKLLIPFILISVVASSFSCNSSRKSIGIEEGWDLLGELKVNFVRDRDALQVHNNNLYTAIRFKIEQKDVHINDLTINYVNGDKLSPNIDDQISADQYSRIIELAAEGKAIRTIDFKYRSQGSILKGRARVLVFGRRYDRGY